MNRTWTLLVGVLMLAACSPSQPPNQDRFSAADRVQWYQQCWNHFNDKKWDDFTKCYAETAISQQSGYGKPRVKGATEIAATTQQLAVMAPDIRGDLQLILVNADHHHMASLSIMHGTNTGPVTSANGKQRKATGKPFGFMFGHSVEIDGKDQLVTDEFGVADSGTLAAQLGLTSRSVRPVMAVPAAPVKVFVASRSQLENKNAAIELQAIEAWNRHDAAAVAALQSDDYVMHDNTHAADMNRAQNAADSRLYWQAFSDARWSTAGVWGVGDYVVIEGQFEGTSTGDVPELDIQTTGHKVEVPFLQIDRFANGKIVESWLVNDSGLFNSQLQASAP